MNYELDIRYGLVCKSPICTRPSISRMLPTLNEKPRKGTRYGANDLVGDAKLENRAPALSNIWSCQGSRRLKAAGKIHTKLSIWAGISESL